MYTVLRLIGLAITATSYAISIAISVHRSDL